MFTCLRRRNPARTTRRPWVAAWQPRLEVLEDRTVPSMFRPTGNMLVNHGDAFTLTELADGRVLAAGGADGVSTLGAAEIYDPDSGAWTITGALQTARAGHSATLLPGGQVLVAGGSSGLSSAELYDPITGTWSFTGSLATGRSAATSVLLDTGKVLIVAGGVPGSGDTFGTASAELYDPAAGTWSATGSLNIARMSQVGVGLSDGRVLIAGGMDRGVTFANFSSAEIYDPASGIWSNTGSMAIGRRGSFTLTTLSSGEVLVAGGGTNWTSIATDKAELFDPNTGVWTTTTPLPATRQGHSATLLADGTVLVAGGNEHPADFGPGTYLNTALIYDPVAVNWTPTTNSMGDVRAGHREVRLPDGSVLVAGGYNGVAYLSTAELYGDECVPAPAGLVAWYSGEGDATDRTGQHDGILMNGAGFAPGKVGQAFQLDGIDDFIRVPHDPALNPATGLTIEAWINSASTAGPHVIASKWNDGASDWSYIFKDHNSSDKLRIELSRDIHNDGGDLAGTTSIPLGTWVHVAATFDGSTIRLYFNGALDAQLFVGPEQIDASTTDMLIGAGFAASSVAEPFAGLIDEPAIYNRALDAAEIAAIHDAGSAGKCVNQAPTNIALSNASVAENQPSGTVVGAFTTTDPDARDTFSYALVSGTGDADNGSFTIDASGNLKTAATFDFETKSSYSIRVRSTDADGLSTEKVFTISVTSVNESPTVTVPAAQTAFEDVDQAIGGLGVGDPEGDSLTVTLAVGHGMLTLGTTTGLTVSGNGSGSVSLSGNIANLNAALASLVYRGALNFSGADPLNITASDGSLSTSGSLAITVKSAAQQAVDLQARVNPLRDAGVLNQGQANSLNVKLNLQNNNGDIGKVQSFLNHVKAFLNAGILTQVQADDLLSWGNILLLSVTRR